MTLAQVVLSDRDKEALSELATETGKSEEQIVSEAVARYLSDAQRTRWRERLRAVKGMWADRTDLPDFAALRREADHRDSRDRE